VLLVTYTQVYQALHETLHLTKANKTFTAQNTELY